MKNLKNGLENGCILYMLQNLLWFYENTDIFPRQRWLAETDALTAVDAYIQAVVDMEKWVYSNFAKQILWQNSDILNEQKL